MGTPTLEKRLDELARLTQVHVYDCESKKEEIRLIRAAIDQGIALAAADLIESLVQKKGDASVPVVSGGANIDLQELAEDVLEVADYLNDACNNQGEILGSMCVDRLMSVHGDLLKLATGTSAATEPDAH